MIPGYFEDYLYLPGTVENGRVVTVSSESAAYAGTGNSWVKLATDANAQAYGYHNPDNATQANKIAFGSSESPSIASPVAGDIYIQI